MKDALAAPASRLPSDPTALPAHASVLHFLTKAVLAAPESGLPSFPTALLSQVSWAKAEPIAKSETATARMMRFMVTSFIRICVGFGAYRGRPTTAAPGSPTANLDDRNKPPVPR